MKIVLHLEIDEKDLKLGEYLNKKSIKEQLLISIKERIKNIKDSDFLICNPIPILKLKKS